MTIIIVSGWRAATFEHHGDIVEQALEPYRSSTAVILRHGKCPMGGVDLIAAEFAHRFGWTVEEFPPDIINGRIQGPARNRAMCLATPKADILLAFPGPNSRGTLDCIRQASRLAIPFHGHPLTPPSGKDL